MHRGPGGRLCDQGKFLVGNLVWHVRRSWTLNQALQEYVAESPAWNKRLKHVSGLVAHLLGMSPRIVSRVEAKFDREGWGNTAGHKHQKAKVSGEGKRRGQINGGSSTLATGNACGLATGNAGGLATGNAGGLAIGSKTKTMTKRKKKTEQLEAEVQSHDDIIAHMVMQRMRMQLATGSQSRGSNEPPAHNRLFPKQRSQRPDPRRMGPVRCWMRVVGPQAARSKSHAQSHGLLHG